MGRTALILLGGLSMIIMLYIHNLGRTSLEAETVVAGQYENQMAKNEARSAMNGALMDFGTNPDFRGSYGEESRFADGGRDSITVTGGVTPGDRVTISVRGWYGATGDTGCVHTVEVSTRTKTAPPWYSCALVTGADINLHGYITLRTDNNPYLNADLHSNGTVTLSNVNNLVQGFGAYCGEGTPVSACAISFQPVSNPTAAPVHAVGGRLLLPEFNAGSYTSLATVTTTGPLIVTDTVHLGTAANPTFWHVAGSVSIAGFIEGYGVIFADSAITVTGSLRQIGNDPGGLNTFALYSSSDIAVAAGSTVEALLYASGNVHFSAHTHLRGSVGARGSFTYNSPTEIRFRPANAILAGPFWGTAYRVIADSYFE